MILKYLFGFIPALICWVGMVFFFLIFFAFDAEYMRRIAIGFDQLANAFMNGDEDETPSGRMGKELKKGNSGCCKWRLRLCKALSILDPTSENHCIDSIGE